jgi:hypothetical protein
LIDPEGCLGFRLTSYFPWKQKKFKLELDGRTTKIEHPKRLFNSLLTKKKEIFDKFHSKSEFFTHFSLEI